MVNNDTHLRTFSCFRRRKFAINDALEDLFLVFTKLNGPTKFKGNYVLIPHNCFGNNKRA